MRAYLTERAVRLSPRSVVTYASHLEVASTFLGRRVDKAPEDVLSRATLAELWAWTSDGRRTITARRAIVQTLERLWAWAYDHEVYGADVPRPRRLELPAPTGTPTTAPTWAELDAVWRELAGDTARAFLIARHTGLRQRQVYGLRWEDIDMQAGELTVRGELGKSQRERQGRVVPLSPHLVRELAGWGVREGRVLSDEGPDYGALAQAWELAGVPAAVWRGRPLHAVRKGFVSGLRALGADADAVEYLVGHSLGLAGVYTAAWSLRLREVVDLVPEVGEAGVSQACPLRTRRTRGPA